MMRSKRRLIASYQISALLTLAAASVAGCGGPERLQLHPATGEIVQAGKPAAGAIVTLFPDASIAATVGALRPSGVADASGKFSLSTYVQNDGVPEGTWIATVRWPDPKVPAETRKRIEDDGDSVPDVFKGRFANPATSSWKVTIVEGENSLPAIDLSKP